MSASRPGSAILTVESIVSCGRPGEYLMKRSNNSPTRVISLRSSGVTSASRSIDLTSTRNWPPALSRSRPAWREPMPSTSSFTLPLPSFRCWTMLAVRAHHVDVSRRSARRP